MMHVEWSQYVLRVVTTFFAAYGLVYLASAVGWPKFFLSNMAINRLDRRNGGRKDSWWLWPLAGLTVISVGVVIYAALYPAISAIPFSWGSHDEYGDWTSTRNYVQTAGAIIGAIGVISCLEKAAEVLVWGPIERRARSALTDAIAPYRTDGDVVRKAAERNLHKELGPGERETKDSEVEWRDSLREAILRRLASSY